MAKLYFRHGVVSSAKTLNLLACAHSYKVQGKKVLVIKPKLDTRFGAERVKSRAGLECQADILVEAHTVFAKGTFSGADCVLVDEAQFVSPEVIEQLRDVAAKEGVPVICYGLRTDFRSRLFPASKRLMELADVIEDVKTTCTFCNRRAILNLKSVDGTPTLAGPTVCLGCEELYLPACYQHFVEKCEAASGKPIDFAEAAVEGARADAEQAKQSKQPGATSNAGTADKAAGDAKEPRDVEGATAKTAADVAVSRKAAELSLSATTAETAEPQCEPTPEKRRRTAEA